MDYEPPVLDKSLRGEELIKQRRKRQVQNETTERGEIGDYEYFNFYSGLAVDEEQEQDVDTNEEEKTLRGLPREIYCDIANTLRWVISSQFG